MSNGDATGRQSGDGRCQPCRPADPPVRCCEGDGLYRDLVENGPVPVCCFTPSGQLTFVNEPYCRYVGRPQEELEGRDFLQQVLEEEREGIRERLARLTPEDPVTAYEHQVLAPDGTVRWQRCTSRALFDGQNQLEGYQSVGVDITDRKRIEREQEELLRMQEEFFSMVSHDLRTPLFSIQGFVDLMLQGRVEDPDVRREFLTRVSKQTHRLVSLVNDLLDMSRLEKGRLELQKEEVQVGELVARVVDELEAMAQQKSISLARQTPASLPTIEADPRRVEQVLVNLVGNALKFVPEQGQVAVGADVEDGELKIWVADTGIGIPSDAIPDLFTKFFQVDRRSRGHADGTGLGLYISRLLVEAHGGRIWVESEEGEGSTFTFAIPLDTSHRVN